MHLLSDLMKGKYVALKRTAEVRKGWQKLLRAGSHTPASQQITEVKVSVKLAAEAVMRSSVRVCVMWLLPVCTVHAGVSA